MALSTSRGRRFALYGTLFVGGLLIVVLGILAHWSPSFIGIAVGVLALGGYGGEAIHSVRRGQALRRDHAREARSTTPPGT
jgi:hypothetical protein